MIYRKVLLLVVSFTPMFITYLPQLMLILYSGSLKKTKFVFFLINIKGSLVPSAVYQRSHEHAKTNVIKYLGILISNDASWNIHANESFLFQAKSVPS